MLVYMPPTITYIYGLKKHYFLLISSTITIFQKVGISGISRTVKYLALCQILTHLIETSAQFTDPMLMLMFWPAVASPGMKKDLATPSHNVVVVIDW